MAGSYCCLCILQEHPLSSSHPPPSFPRPFALGAGEFIQPGCRADLIHRFALVAPRLGAKRRVIAELLDPLQPEWDEGRWGGAPVHYWPG